MERIKLTDLRPADGATHSDKKVGRGRASGHGKTSTRGNNGEGQRSGRSQKRGFEGGQMPAYRRAPKLKGFELVNQTKNYELNVSKLDKIIDVNLFTIDALKLCSMKVAAVNGDLRRIKQICKNGVIYC